MASRIVHIVLLSSLLACSRPFNDDSPWACLLSEQAINRREMNMEESIRPRNRIVNGDKAAFHAFSKQDMREQGCGRHRMGWGGGALTNGLNFSARRRTWNMTYGGIVVDRRWVG